MGNTPVICVARYPPIRKAAHDFHLDNVGEFLLPRTIACFDKLAEAGELWVAVEGDDAVVAMCYVTRRRLSAACDEDEEESHAEFGGWVVHKNWETTGLASAIGTVAIAAHHLHDRPPHGLIAHVHVENARPIDGLKRLGFSKVPRPVEVSKAELEAELGHPITMKADKDGFIRGNTFEFARAHLAVLADRLSTGRLAKVDVNIDNKYFQGEALLANVATLRQLAGA